LTAIAIANGSIEHSLWDDAQRRDRVLRNPQIREVRRFEGGDDDGIARAHRLEGGSLELALFAGAYSPAVSSFEAFRTPASVQPLAQ